MAETNLDILYEAQKRTDGEINGLPVRVNKIDQSLGILKEQLREIKGQMSSMFEFMKSEEMPSSVTASYVFDEMLPTWAPKKIKWNLPIKKVNINEYDERKAQGLCFHCDEKHTWRHVCNPKLFNLVIATDGFEELREETTTSQLDIEGMKCENDLVETRDKEMNGDVVEDTCGIMLIDDIIRDDGEHKIIKRKILKLVANINQGINFTKDVEIHVLADSNGMSGMRTCFWNFIEEENYSLAQQGVYFNGPINNRKYVEVEMLNEITSIALAQICLFVPQACYVLLYQIYELMHHLIINVKVVEVPPIVDLLQYKVWNPEIPGEHKEFEATFTREVMHVRDSWYGEQFWIILNMPQLILGVWTTDTFKCTDFNSLSSVASLVFGELMKIFLKQPGESGTLAKSSRGINVLKFPREVITFGIIEFVALPTLGLGAGVVYLYFEKSNVEDVEDMRRLSYREELATLWNKLKCSISRSYFNGIKFLSIVLFVWVTVKL